MPNPCHFEADAVNKWVFLFIKKKEFLNRIYYSPWNKHYFFQESSCLDMGISRRKLSHRGSRWGFLWKFYQNCCCCAKENMLTSGLLLQIRFRVNNISYPPIPIEADKESHRFAPMVITVSAVLVLSSFVFYLHFSQEVLWFTRCWFLLNCQKDTSHIL